MEKESEKEWIYVYAQLIRFVVHLKLTQNCKSAMLKKIFRKRIRNTKKVNMKKSKITVK